MFVFCFVLRSQSPRITQSASGPGRKLQAGCLGLLQQGTMPPDIRGTLMAKLAQPFLEAQIVPRQELLEPSTQPESDAHLSVTASFPTFVPRFCHFFMLFLDHLS